MTRIILLIVYISVCLSSCASRKPLISSASNKICFETKTGHKIDSIYFQSVNNCISDAQVDSNLLKQRFSNRAFQVAKNLNILPLLTTYTKAEQDKSLSNVELLALRTQVLDRIQTGFYSIASFEAVVDCEMMRCVEAGGVLQGWIDNRNNRLNVYSIVIGGVATVAGAILAIKGVDAVLEQGTAVALTGVGVYWGFRALGSKKKIQYSHEANILNDIYTAQNQSGLIPPEVWDFMNKPFIKDGKSITGLELIKNEWHEKIFEGEPEEESMILFGAGGNYSVDLLDQRLKMFQIINSELDYMKYDLKRLQQEMILGFNPKK